MRLKDKILGSHFIIEYPWALFNPFYIHRRLLYKSLKKHAHFLSGDILDFGCGSKPYQSLFNFKKYIGIDIENPGHSHKNEKVDVIFNGVDIPFQDNTFDSCLSSEVLEHVLNPEKVLSEIRRVLKSKGTVLFTTPFVWDEHEAPYDFYRYTSFGLKQKILENDFDIVEYEKLGNFPELILQLILIKLNRNLSSIKPFKYIFILTICPFINLFSVCFQNMSTESNSLYLGHTIVFRKKNAP